MTDREPPPVIPREVLFGNPDRASPRLSPDGASISYLAPVDGVLNIWVGPEADPAAARPVTDDRERGIRIYFWAYTSRHVLYLQDKGRRRRLARLQRRPDLRPNKRPDSSGGRQRPPEELSHKLPDEVLLGLNDRDAEYHDLHRRQYRHG